MTSKEITRMINDRLESLDKHSDIRVDLVHETNGLLLMEIALQLALLNEKVDKE